jgi:hypothetical protein
MAGDEGVAGVEIATQILEQNSMCFRPVAAIFSQAASKPTLKGRQLSV